MLPWFPGHVAALHAPGVVQFEQGGADEVLGRGLEYFDAIPTVGLANAHGGAIEAALVVFGPDEIEMGGRYIDREHSSGSQV